MFKCKIGIFEILGRCLIGFVGEGTELELTRFDPYLQYGPIRIPTRPFWGIFGSLGSNLYFSDFPKNRFVGNFSKVPTGRLGLPACLEFPRGSGDHGATVSCGAVTLAKVSWKHSH